MDIIPEAVAQANQFKSKFDLKYPAHFEVGSFDHIPLEDDSVDAVICIDSLWAALDKIQAMREIKRVMKPGAKSLFTFWDLLAVESVPLLAHSGLSFVEREDTPDWQDYQMKVYEGILKYEKELVEEMGESADMLIYEAKASPPYLNLSVRRICHWELK